jgi:hypothetical protein
MLKNQLWACKMGVTTTFSRATTLDFSLLGRERMHKKDCIHLARHYVFVEARYNWYHLGIINAFPAYKN